MKTGGRRSSGVELQSSSVSRQLSPVIWMAVFAHFSTASGLMAAYLPPFSRAVSLVMIQRQMLK
jgi:hypothetical protein